MRPAPRGSAPGRPAGVRRVYAARDLAAEGVVRLPRRKPGLGDPRRRPKIGALGCARNLIRVRPRRGPAARVHDVRRRPRWRYLGVTERPAGGLHALRLSHLGTEVVPQLVRHRLRDLRLLRRFADRVAVGGDGVRLTGHRALGVAEFGGAAGSAAPSTRGPCASARSAWPGTRGGLKTGWSGSQLGGSRGTPTAAPGRWSRSEPPALAAVRGLVVPGPVLPHLGGAVQFRQRQRSHTSPGRMPVASWSRTIAPGGCSGTAGWR